MHDAQCWDNFTFTRLDKRRDSCYDAYIYSLAIESQQTERHTATTRSLPKCIMTIQCKMHPKFQASSELQIRTIRDLFLTRVLLC